MAEEVTTVTLEIPYGPSGASTRSVVVSDDKETLMDETVLNFLLDHPDFDSKLPPKVAASIQGQRAARDQKSEESSASAASDEAPSEDADKPRRGRKRGDE